MSAEVPIRPCRYCGEPKRDDSWCASAACAERVSAHSGPDFGQFTVDEVAASVAAARAVDPELDRECAQADDALGKP